VLSRYLKNREFDVWQISKLFIHSDGSLSERCRKWICFSGVVLKYARRFGIPKRDEQTATGVCNIMLFLSHPAASKFSSSATAEATIGALRA